MMLDHMMDYCLQMVRIKSKKQLLLQLLAQLLLLSAQLAAAKDYFGTHVGAFQDRFHDVQGEVTNKELFALSY